MRALAIAVKNTIIAFNSCVMNGMYRLKIGKKKLAAYRKELDGAIAALSSREKAAGFVKAALVYKPDPLCGYFDWVCDPVVLYARVREGMTAGSCDCDDFASLLCYVLKGMGIYDSARCRAVLSRKPFLTQGHSFVTGQVRGGGIDVYSPYAFLGMVSREDEIVPMLEKHFGDVKFFPFVV